MPPIFLFFFKICEKNNLSLFEKGCFYYYIMFPAETKSHKIFRIQAFQFRQNETSVFADEHIVEPDFTAAVFRCHDEYQIPVDSGFITVGCVVIAVAGSEVDAASNLFIEQDVVHGFCDIRVYADGKFTHISCAFVGVEDVFQTFFVVAVAVDDLPVFECEFYIFKCKAVVFGGVL